MDSKKHQVWSCCHFYYVLSVVCWMLLLDQHCCSGSSCNFHDMKHMATEDVVWETDIVAKPNGNDRTEIEFKKNYMIARHVYLTPYGTNYSEQFYVRTCISKMFDKFVVRHEEYGKPPTYACLEFVSRGLSVVQLRESSFTAQFDLQLCQGHRLKLNPWPLILRRRIEDEYVLCPLKGGFDMKIVNSYGLRNGCNMKALPMRMESECIAGEGMNFYFRSDSCLQGTPMDTHTNLICVTEWWDSGYTFNIVKTYKGDVWCLRTQNTTDQTKEAEAYLFFDLICPRGTEDIMGWSGTSGKSRKAAANYIIMSLNRVIQTSLCQDEYKECTRMLCTRLTEKECPHSCRKCDPSTPPPVCSFPRGLRGPWYQKDYDNVKDVHITESMFYIERVGSFKCVSLSKVSTRSDGRYSVLSVFRNGCRPRYSCIVISSYSPMVMGYVLSKSIVWPLIDDYVKESICSNQRFVPDVKPIRDTYRSFPNSLKPIVSRSHYENFQDCGFRTSYEIRLALKPGRGCYGSMYQDCLDSTQFRIEMKNCPVHQQTTDYYCLSRFQPNYWEDAIIMQNRDNLTDAVCLLFTSIKEDEVVVMAASECNKMTWSFVRAKFMKPLAVYTIKPEIYPCKDIPMRTTTTEPSATMVIHEPQQVDFSGSQSPFGIPGILSEYDENKNIYRKRKLEREKKQGKSGAGSHLSPRQLTSGYLSLLLLASALPRVT